MLFANNPDARTTIIDQTRRDHGQHLAAGPDATPALAPAPPSRVRIRLGHRSRVVATG